MVLCVARTFLYPCSFSTIKRLARIAIDRPAAFIGQRYTFFAIPANPKRFLNNYPYPHGARFVNDVCGTIGVATQEYITP